jgi:hypothetical protein
MARHPLIEGVGARLGSGFTVPKIRAVASAGRKLA